MATESFFCEDPRHEGDRYLPYRQDQYTAVIAFTDRAHASRLREVTPRMTGDATPKRNRGGIRFCRRCAERYIETLEHGGATLEWGRDYVPVDQPEMF